MHINLAQRVLKQQFPEFNGLKSTGKEQILTESNVANKSQIIHGEKCHHCIVPQISLVGQMMLSQ